MRLWPRFCSVRACCESISAMYGKKVPSGGGEHTRGYCGITRSAIEVRFSNAGAR